MRQGAGERQQQDAWCKPDIVEHAEQPGGIVELRVSESLQESVGLDLRQVTRDRTEQHGKLVQPLEQIAELVCRPVEHRDHPGARIERLKIVVDQPLSDEAPVVCFKLRVVTP